MTEPTPDDAVYTVRAQAIVELVHEYEEAHPPTAPCFSEALALMTAVCQP